MFGMQGVLLVMIGALSLYLMWHPSFRLFAKSLGKAPDSNTPSVSGNDSPSEIARDRRNIPVRLDEDSDLIYVPSLGGYVRSADRSLVITQ